MKAYFVDLTVWCVRILRIPKSIVSVKAVADEEAEDGGG